MALLAPMMMRRRPNGDRADRLAYACQALSLAFYVLTLWIEVYLDTRPADVRERDVFRESHRRWRLRSSLLFLVWTILGGLTAPFAIGWLVLAAAYVWFIMRTVRGWRRWRRRQPMSTATSAARGPSASPTSAMPRLHPLLPQSAIGRQRQSRLQY